MRKRWRCTLSRLKIRGSGLLLDVIPGSVIGAFASGNILQVLLFAVLFGFALHRLGSKGQLIFNVIESFSRLSSALSI